MDEDMLPSTSSASAQLPSDLSEHLHGGVDTEIIQSTESIVDQTADESSYTDMASDIQTDDVDCPEFDIGKWVGKSSELSDEMKSKILRNRWVPPENYNFYEDSENPRRRFKHSWLKEYDPWLTYSKKLQGGLCLYCVLFPPNVVQGALGALIATPLNRYNDVNNDCRSHATSQWHRAATMSANSFLHDVPVDVQMVSGYNKLIEGNKQILSNIISTIIFCGTHDMALRGTTKDSGKCS